MGDRRQRDDDEGLETVGAVAGRVMQNIKWKSGRDEGHRPGQLEETPRKGLVTGNEPEYPPLADVLHPEADGTASGFTRDAKGPEGMRPARAMGK